MQVTFSLLDSDLTTCCCREGHTDHIRTIVLVHEVQVLAGQAHKFVRFSRDPRPLPGCCN